LRRELFLTLDLTPGFILQDMVGVVHIGKAAKLASVSLDTIRFYQRLGLIKSAGRSSGGYRLFNGEDIHDLRFVRHAQELGFSLTEVKELMPLRRKHHVCSEVQSMLNHKLGGCSGKDQQSRPMGSGACRRASQLQSRAAPKRGNQA
jgi:DNA-binding transcriptional MerR regulator